MHDVLLTCIRRYVALDADESALVDSLFEHRYTPKKTLLLAQGDLARHEAFVVWKADMDHADFGPIQFTEVAIQDWQDSLIVRGQFVK